MLTALYVERNGQELSARSLRELQLRPLLGQLGQLIRFNAEEAPLRPARPGPAGHGKAHWRRVWKLYQQAQRAGVRSHIKWMRDEWSPPVPDATMRRWVQRARQMHEAGEL